MPDNPMSSQWPRRWIKPTPDRINNRPGTNLEMAVNAEEPYDVNFCFPVKELENERIKLTPFIPSIHAEPYFEGTKDHPEIYEYLPLGPYTSSSEIVDQVFVPSVQPDPGVIVFSVLDKTRLLPESGEPRFAGMIGLLHTIPSQLTTELGFVIILPEFQRTHVTTNAIGLMLEWSLDVPSKGGVGMRRVQWETNITNVASRRVAERMGFQFEMVQRWQRILGEHKGGEAVIGEDGRKDWPGRHTAILSICWDDWEVWREKNREEMKK